jgi:hypothetical protein
MSDRLPPTVAKTRLYLPNPATRAILFRPIKSNIAEAHGQIAQLLEAEYSPEEAAQVCGCILVVATASTLSLSFLSCSSFPLPHPSCPPLSSQCCVVEVSASYAPALWAVEASDGHRA